MLRNTFFNPPDKLSTRQKIKKHCEDIIIPDQKQKLKMYKKLPEDYLIRDKNKEYKIVSRDYYLYHIQDDELDTDTELIDEDDDIEEQRILNKYK